MKLFDQYDAIFTPTRLEAFEKLVDQPNGDLKKAVKGVYYTLVAGLIRRSQSSMGSNLLFNQISQSGGPGGVIEQLDVILGDRKKAEEVQEKGLKVISQVFPAFKSPLISTLGAYAGVNKQSATWVITVVTQVLMDALAQVTQEEQFTASDLIYFIQKHQEPLLSSAPEGLLEKMVPALGLQDLQNLKINPVHKKSTPPPAKKDEVVEEEIASNGQLFSGKALFIGILVVALLAGGIYWFQQKPASSNVAATPTEEESITPDQIDSLLTAMEPVKEEAPETAVVYFSDMAAYIADASQPAGKRFSTPELAFSVGQIVPDTSAQAAVNALVQILATHPNLEIKIEGYGTRPDPKLGLKRASNLKTTLLSNGIENRRVDAVGVPDGKKMAIVVVKK